MIQTFSWGSTEYFSPGMVDKTNVTLLEKCEGIQSLNPFPTSRSWSSESSITITGSWHDWRKSANWLFNSLTSCKITFFVIYCNLVNKEIINGHKRMRRQYHNSPQYGINNSLCRFWIFSVTPSCDLSASNISTPSGGIIDNYTAAMIQAQAMLANDFFGFY